MKMLVIVLFLASVNVAAQNDTLPFRLTAYNNILIPAVINEVDSVDLMFHTAINSVSLTNAALERLKSKYDVNEAQINTWGGEATANYSEGHKLAIGGSKWDSVRIWTNERSGQGSDGKFGPNLFDDQFIEINFEKSLLVIHQKLPSDLSEYSKFDIKYDNSTVHISGECSNGKDLFANQFMIHSGYGGTILLDDEFASKSKMNKLKILDVSELKDSADNVLKKKKAIMPLFSLETFDFKNLPLGFFEGKIVNQKTSVIGGELLKRFNILIDKEQSVIYMKANSLMNLPFKEV